MLLCVLLKFDMNFGRIKFELRSGKIIYGKARQTEENGITRYGPAYNVHKTYGLFAKTFLRKGECMVAVPFKVQFYRSNVSLGAIDLDDGTWRVTRHGDLLIPSRHKSRAA